MTDTSQRDARPVPVPSGRFTRMAQLGGMTASVAGNMAVGGLAQLTRGQRPAIEPAIHHPAPMHARSAATPKSFMHTMKSYNVSWRSFKSNSNICTAS